MVPGAGRGLGAGSAEGLGLSQATGPFVVPSKDASGIAEGFTHELSSSFLSDARTNVQSSIKKTQLLAIAANAAPAAEREVLVLARPGVLGCPMPQVLRSIQGIPTHLLSLKASPMRSLHHS